MTLKNDVENAVGGAVEWTQHAITRYGALFVLLISCFYAIGESRDVAADTAMTIAAFEAVALLLTYFVLYVISPIKWLKELTDEIQQRQFERNKSRFTASLVMVAVVVASVHILVAVSVFAIYFTKYSPIP